MRAAHSLLVALLLTGVSLAGCLEPQTEGTTVEPAADVPVPPTTTGTTATVHRPTGAAPATADANATASAEGGNETPLEDVPMLDPGVPLALGGMRVSPLPSFEPTLGVSSDGSIFLSTFSTRIPNYLLLQRSDDKGMTWTEITPKAGPVSVPPQSNDPYVYVDPDTDRVFLSDLQALMCSTLSLSDDKGASWITNPVGCGQPVGVHDHQTVFTAKPRLAPTAGYPKVVYYCINRVVDSACATSLNGGLTFGPLRPLVYSGIAPTQCLVAGGLHAHGAPAPDGTVYLPRAYCGNPTIAFTKDDGLTWKTVTISTTVKARGHEVAAAVDEAGNVYTAWIGTDRLPWSSVSTDGGETWAEPRMVAPSDVKTTDFPTIAAGADGRIVIAYYGTTSDKDYGDMKNEDTWNGYLTLLTDATNPTSVAMTVTVNEPADPLARGVCGGSRCSNGPGDFIDVVIDAEGRPWAAMADVCADGCPDGNQGNNGFVGTLLEGPALRGELAALPSLAVVEAVEEPADA